MAGNWALQEELCAPVWAMSETVSLEWIGTTLRSIQAEQRSIQAEQRSIRDENRLIRQSLIDALTVLTQRIANFEAYLDTRFDQLSARLDRIERDKPAT